MRKTKRSTLCKGSGKLVTDSTGWCRDCLKTFSDEAPSKVIDGVTVYVVRDHKPVKRKPLTSGKKKAVGQARRGPRSRSRVHPRR